jgi:uncharacterized protein
MSAAENKKIVENAFTQWLAGDSAAPFRLLAKNVHWTVIGTTPISAAYKSKREFLTGAGPLMDHLATPIKPELVGITAVDDKVILEFKAHAIAKNSTVYDQVYCWVMRMENGEVVEGKAYLDTDLLVRVLK